MGCSGLEGRGVDDGRGGGVLDDASKVACEKDRAFGGVGRIGVDGERGGAETCVGGVGPEYADPFKVARGMELCEKAAFGAGVWEGVRRLVLEGKGGLTDVFAEDVKSASMGSGGDPSELSVGGVRRVSDIPLAACGFVVAGIDVAVAVVVDAVRAILEFVLFCVCVFTVAPLALLAGLFADRAGADVFGGTRSSLVADAGGRMFGGFDLWEVVVLDGFNGICFDATAILDSFDGICFGATAILDGFAGICFGATAILGGFGGGGFGRQTV